MLFRPIGTPPPSLPPSPPPMVDEQPLEQFVLGSGELSFRKWSLRNEDATPESQPVLDRCLSGSGERSFRMFLSHASSKVSNC